MQIQPQVGRRSYENVCADVQTIELWFSTRSETRREAEQYYPEQMDGVTWCSTCASLTDILTTKTIIKLKQLLLITSGPKYKSTSY